jgi:hypothetical protein
MANYSAKERLVASILSATPGLKGFIKDLYININAIKHKKDYKQKIVSDLIVGGIQVVKEDSDVETFGGYYDVKLMNNKGLILSHGTCNSTIKLPSGENAVEILLTDIKTNESTVIDSTKAFNWQQGSRLYWISEDKFIFNSLDVDVESDKYIAKVYSVSEGDFIGNYDKPVQASFEDKFFLAINYSRLLNMRPDYGYRNLPEITKNELKDYENDGIWKVDLQGDTETFLLHSLKQVLAIETKDIFEKCNHKVNHLMINPSGTAFMFIHRYYLGKRRFDRLMLSDYSNLSVILDDEYVSHCYWLDDERIIGYVQVDGVKGYYIINVRTKEVSSCEEITKLGYGDGHPSSYKDWVVFDSYPDKSRMQTLSVYHLKSKEVIKLLEVYQNPKYKGETRCDLHPRFSSDGKYITFDSVFNNKRQHCVIDVSNIILRK